MIDAACVETKSDQNIKCEDGKRFAIFRNVERKEYRKIRVDGCVVKDGIRADWVLEANDAAVVIELKGRDAEHAAKQVLETAKLWKNTEKRCSRVAGLIVARQYPRASSTMQLKQQTFSRQLKAHFML